MKENYMIGNNQISEMKAQISQMKKELQAAIKDDAEYDGEADLMLAALSNAEENLATVKDVEALEPRKQARLYADMLFLSQMIMEQSEDECCHSGGCEDDEDECCAHEHNEDEE